jgi:hypothetical protein
VSNALTVSAKFLTGRPISIFLQIRIEIQTKLVCTILSNFAATNKHKTQRNSHVAIINKVNGQQKCNSQYFYQTNPRENLQDI